MSTGVELPQLTPKDFASDQEVRWCPRCGDYSILAQMKKVLPTLNIPKENIVFVSGIGCSSRFPYYMATYGMHTIHGRAPAVATGLKVSRPDLQVWCITGDGDALSIGGNHFMHMIRRNVDLKVVLFNNQIYGLTKGQVSPTSRKQMVAYTTPYGGVEEPLNPLSYMLAYGASFVAQCYAGKPAECAELIQAAILHKGFSYINILSNCPSFNKIDTPQYFKELVTNIPEDHDYKDFIAASNLVNRFRIEGREPIGLIYKNPRPTLDEQMSELVERVGGSKDYDIRKIIDLSKP